MAQTRANPETTIHDILAKRWSPRAFDSNRPVEREKLSACLEAARWSSSCFGAEPWRFIVAERSHNPDIWQQMLNTLAEKNRLWAAHAPVLLLALCQDTFEHNGAHNRWAQYDTGQAMMAFALQAVAEGLVSHPMGGFDAKAAATIFGIPEGFTLMSITAIGYEGDINRLADDFRNTELATRRRKPIHDIAFTHWPNQTGSKHE